jgi:2-hydroxy-6-oxonona-2,4-dienedioate hydrolase
MVSLTVPAGMGRTETSTSVGGSSSGAVARRVERTTLWPLDPADQGEGALFAKVVEIGPGGAEGGDRAAGAGGGGGGVGGVGVRTPVVFLHGLVGLNDHWEEVVGRVQGRMRCVLFELPLLQLSGADCSIEGVTRLTERFLRESGLGPAVLVGNSFGGHVALRLAIERPGLVKGLVLAGSSGLIEKSIVADVQIRPSREWLRRKIGELFFDERFMREADLDRAHAELTDRHGARAMVKLSRSARRDVLREEIGRISAPVLLVWGREDVVTPMEAAHGFAERIRRSRLVVYERCGHVPMIECADRFAADLAEFVLGLESGG